MILRQRSLRGLLTVRDIILIVTLLVSGNVVFFTHFPVTADRSISVFILAYMDRAQGPLTSEQISDSVVQEYMLARHAIDKRLTERLLQEPSSVPGTRTSSRRKGAGWSGSTS